MQLAEELLRLSIDAEHQHATLARESAQWRNAAKLRVALLRVHGACDQLLAQGTTAKAGLLQPGGGDAAADPHAMLQELLRQLPVLQVGPAHMLIRWAPGVVGFQHLMQRRGQLRLAVEHRPTPATATTHPLGRTAGTLRMIAIPIAHLLQFADAGVERASTRPQDSCDVGHTPVADLQRLDRRVAATMLLPQRAIVQPHCLLVPRIVAQKLVHGSSPPEHRQTTRMLVLQ